MDVYAHVHLTYCSFFSTYVVCKMRSVSYRKFRRNRSPRRYRRSRSPGRKSVRRGYRSPRRSRSSHVRRYRSTMNINGEQYDATQIDFELGFTSYDVYGPIQTSKDMKERFVITNDQNPCKSMIADATEQQRQPPVDEYFVFIDKRTGEPCSITTEEWNALRDIDPSPPGTWKLSCKEYFKLNQFLTFTRVHGFTPDESIERVCFEEIKHYVTLNGEKIKLFITDPPDKTMLELVGIHDHELHTERLNDMFKSIRNTQYMSEESVRRLIKNSQEKKWLKVATDDIAVESQRSDVTVEEVINEPIVVYSNSDINLRGEESLHEDTKGYIHAHTWPFWFQSQYGPTRNEITIPTGTTVYYHAYKLTTQYAPKGQVHASLVFKSNYGLEQSDPHEEVIPERNDSNEIRIRKWSLRTQPKIDEDAA